MKVYYQVYQKLRKRFQVNRFKKKVIVIVKSSFVIFSSQSHQVPGYFFALCCFINLDQILKWVDDKRIRKKGLDKVNFN